MRLNIAAGTAVRFEPGEEKEVELVEFGGKKKYIGFNNLNRWKCYQLKQDKSKAIKSLPATILKTKQHELTDKQDKICQHVWPYTGDKIRLGDTELFIEIEKDFTVYGDEANLAVAKQSVMGWRNRQRPPERKGYWIL